MQLDQLALSITAVCLVAAAIAGFFIGRSQGGAAVIRAVGAAALALTLLAAGSFYLTTFLAIQRQLGGFGSVPYLLAGLLLGGVGLLDAHPLRVMREPDMAYLRGEAPAGAGWLYRRRPDSADALLARL